ncbi:unnamed protein product [Sphagnum jensenii]|uniref:GTD-binding domain-containing protein n=1 Tax=Sphagnum jensenii TaxID=128206 RepID=A0ABP1BXF5_9BRYO
MEEASSNASSGLDNNRDLEENGENERLLKALRDEREAQAALYHELEKERNAAATAANEAMAMITRLQEEKALVQMEARQFQRMVEEKTVYDQEAMEILKEVLARREEEKNQLEDEMRKCKTKLLGRDQATVPERRRNETMQPGCSSRDTEDKREIEEKRLSVLEYVWKFEEQLHHHQQGGRQPPSAPTGGRPKSAGDEQTSEDERRRTMCHHSNSSPQKAATVVSGKLEKEENLGEDDETCRSMGLGARAPSVDKEIMHLTLRLKTLEADRHLMKQTIESLRRENVEMKLLQEIAQQLRELRDMEQKDSQKQSNPFPLASSCQGMMSFTHLFNSAQIQLSKLAHVCLGNVVTRDHKAHVGLGHLLHFSPKPSTCITQVRRANIPATLSAIKGGGFGTSANIEVAKWLLQTG